MLSGKILLMRLLKNKIAESVRIGQVCFLVAFSIIFSCGVAQAGNSTYPGCADGFADSYYDALDNHAQAMAAKHRGTAIDIMKQQDSTLSLSCFDQAIMNSGKAGFIFSDVFVTSAQINTWSGNSQSMTNVSFNGGIGTGLSNTGVYSGGLGGTDFLVKEARDVINSTLDNIWNNFSNSAGYRYNASYYASILGSISMGTGNYTADRSTVENYNFNCPRMGDLWNDGTSAAPLSVVGAGIERDAKYTAYRDMLNNTAAVSSGVSQTLAGDDSGTISDALTDSNKMNTLTGANNIANLFDLQKMAPETSWNYNVPRIQVSPPTGVPSVSALIGEM